MWDVMRIALLSLIATCLVVTRGAAADTYPNAQATVADVTKGGATKYTFTVIYTAEPPSRIDGPIYQTMAWAAPLSSASFRRQFEA